MTLFLRLLLLSISFFTFWYVTRKIRKSQMQIEDSVFWFGFMFILSMLGAFPGIGIYISDVIGFYSPINFVFLSVIFVLLIKCFFQSIKLSQLENKIKLLSQRIAIDKFERETGNLDGDEPGDE